MEHISTSHFTLTGSGSMMNTNRWEQPGDGLLYLKGRDSMENHYEVIIVGAGSMGMAAGYYLAKKGVRTLMIDAFDPPHSNGSHSGDTRLIRHACGEGLDYVPLAMRAQELWDDLQTKTSETIFRKTGVLTYGPPQSDFVGRAIEGGRAYDLNIETLSADEINQRWAGISIDDDHVGCYEPDAGVLFSENSIRTFRRIALENGAELKVNAPVQEIEVHEDSARVSTHDASYTSDKLIISGGAWNKRILDDLGLNLKLTPSRRVIAWFNSDDDLYRSDNFPGFFADLTDSVYYGFPCIDGAGLKVGRYDNGEDMAPEYMNREFGVYDKDEGDLRRFLGAQMEQANGRLNVGKVCIFTNTPDEHFIIDKHPEHPHVAIAAGFSGHGYKFSSVVGEILGDLVTEGSTKLDISLFSATRPAIQQQSMEKL